MNKQEIEKAIELLKWVMEEPNHRMISDRSKERVYNIAISALQQQLTNGWIPVASGRLPEDGKKLLVDDGDGVFRGTYGNGYWWLYLKEGLRLSYSVIAWQPLAEPYKEVSE